MDPDGAPPADEREDQARNDEADGGAVDADPQSEDQQRIEDGCDDRTGERHVHRPVGVTHTARSTPEKPMPSAIRMFEGSVIMR